MNGNKKAIFAGILGNGIFGLSFLFSKIALGYVSPVALLAIRFDIAFLTMTALVLTKIIKVNFKGKNMKSLLLLGLLQPIIYFLCENYGLQYSTSSIAGVIIAIIPIVSFFTGFIFLKERFEIRQLAWAVVSLVGVSIISMVGRSEGNLQLLGLVLLLGAVIAGAMYNTLSRGISGEFSASERTYMMFLMGAVFFTVLSIATMGSQWFVILGHAFSHGDFVVTVVYLGIISSIIAFYSLNYSVSYLPVRQATSFASLTSIISVAAGLLVLHESVSPIQWLAIVLILVGVYKVNVG